MNCWYSRTSDWTLVTATLLSQCAMYNPRHAQMSTLRSPVPNTRTMIDLDRITAIDVHVHTERSRAGHDPMPPVAARGGRALLPRLHRRRAADRRRRRRLLPRAQLAAVVFTVDWESSSGVAPIPNEEIAEAARENPDVLIPFASVDPARAGRASSARRRLIDEHDVHGFKFHPNLQAFFPNDRAAYPLYEVIAEAGLPALFHTGHSGIGTGVPGGGGLQAQVLEPALPRRRRRRLPGAEDRARAPVVPVAGRGDLGLPAQGERLDRPVRLVAEVLPAAARPVREHAAARRRCCSAPTSR